jgi:hypothetical protein
MAETPGSLIDKLFTVDTKMWNNQEVLYEIRRMDYEAFCSRFNLSYDCSVEGEKNSSRELYNVLKKACDLNVQRNDLILEIDKNIETLVNNAAVGKQQTVGFNPHKTY